MKTRIHFGINSIPHYKHQYGLILHRVSGEYESGRNVFKINLHFGKKYLYCKLTPKGKAVEYVGEYY
jgi:hypothetical protein